MVHGGAQLNTLMCAAEQGRRGHDVTLVTGTETGSEGSLLERARREPIRVIEVPSLVRRPQPWLDLEATLALYSLLGEGYDVIHTHTSKAGIVGRLAARMRGSSVVVHTPHGHIFHGYFNAMQERIFVLLERIGARLCDCLIMLTEGDLKDHLAQNLAPPDHFLVVPSGVDLAQFSPEKLSPASFGLPTGKRLVGTTLRLVQVKGVLDLVEAFRTVADTVPEAHLAIAGDGPLREEIVGRISALGLRDHITLLGHVDPVSPFLQTLDLFVLPSHNEGMGRAVVEAMACALPIVATRIGGLPDLVIEGHNGWLVPPREPTALAASLIAALRQSDGGRGMGERSFVHSRSFSAEIMYDRLEKLYLDLYRRK